MRTTVRAMPDPEGRPVDMLRWPELVTAIGLERLCPRSEIQAIVAGSLRSIAGSTIRRWRERSMMVYLGHYQCPDGRQATVVAVPEPIAAEVFQAILRDIESLGVVEIGIYSPEDLHAVPLFRYEAGLMVTYYDAFDAREQSPFRADDFEVRGYEVWARSGRRRDTMPLPRLCYHASHIHSLESWLRSREEAMRFIYDVIGPGSFRALRRRVEDHFGIQVLVRHAARMSWLGAIETGWATGPQPATPIRIRIRSDLSDQQKYVVLAHELAHYVLHFPLLFVGQLVEQVAWVVPDVEDAWQRSRREILGPLLDWIEMQANGLAINLLISPQLPPARLASLIVDGRHALTVEDVAWRMLQPYFPETSSRTFGWRNYDELLRLTRVDAEVATTAGHLGTLFHQFLAAALLLDDPDFQRKNHAMEAGIGAVTTHMLSTIIAMTHEAKMPDTPADPTSVDPPEVTLVGEWEARRVIHSPLVVPDGLNAPPRTPLVPVPGRRRLYTDPRAPDQIADLRTWRKRRPNDAIVIYPNADVPKSPLWGYPDG